MKEVLDDCPEEERFDLAIYMLKEFKDWAKDMRKTLKKASPEKAAGKGR